MDIEQTTKADANIASTLWQQASGRRLVPPFH